MTKNKLTTLPLNKKGQILIEFLVIAPVLISLTFLITQYVYKAYASYWIQLATYESNICMAQHRVRGICKTELIKKIKVGAPFGNIKNIKIVSSQDNYTSEVSWTYLKKNFKYSHRLEKYD